MAQNCPKKDKKFEIRQALQGLSAEDMAEILKDFQVPQQ